MKRSFLYVIFSLFLLLLPIGQTTANSNDSIRLSLLTCAPGEVIYTLFGHTAIRYENPSQGIDVVFNYGLFSFDIPNFALRFSLGETDYRLGVIDYPHFAGEYAYFGRSVWQQTLNLNNEEKAELIRLLQENYRPENRVYRYNFFYDNCATRPRDKIEESIAGKVIYPVEPQDGSRTFREIVHQYCKGHPWARFGIDLCIGSEADRPITQRQMMFAPFYLMDAFAGAQITGDSIQRPLVTDSELIVDATPEEDESLDTHSAAIRSSPLYTYRRRYHLRHPPTDRTLGSRPHIVRYGRYRRMYPCVPGPLLRTPGCQLQFPVICLSSGPASFPSLHHILCPKREEMLVFDLKSYYFNTFYSAFSGNSAKI